MKNLKVRLSTPTVDKRELKKIKTIFKNSWLGYGPNVGKFEDQWSKYFNVKNSIGKFLHRGTASFSCCK